MLTRPTSGARSPRTNRLKRLPRERVEAVGVAGGDEREPHGLGGDKGSVVTDGRAGGNGAHADDRGFPGEHRLQSGARGGKRWRLVGKSKAGSNLGHDAVERKAGTQQGLHAVARGKLGDGARLACEQRGGVAHVEPLGEKPGGGDAAQALRRGA